LGHAVACSLDWWFGIVVCQLAFVAVSVAIVLVSTLLEDHIHAFAVVLIFILAVPTFCEESSSYFSIR
jgi:hypothetical protein